VCVCVRERERSGREREREEAGREGKRESAALERKKTSFFRRSFFLLRFFPTRDLFFSLSPKLHPTSREAESWFSPFLFLFSFTSAMAPSVSEALSSRRAANGGRAGSSRRAASATAPRATAAAAAAARNARDSSSLPSTSGRVGRERRSMPCLRPVHARSSASAAARRSRSPSPQSTRHDVVGLGQAMVDFSAAVDDAFLAEFGVAKGGRR